MSSQGYYTNSYKSAHSSSRSNKKTKRASRRKEEDKSGNYRKQITAANSDTNEQRRAEAVSVKRQENTKVERRDAPNSNSKDKQLKKPVQNNVDASTMTDRDADGEGAYQKVLSVLGDSFLQINHPDKEKRPERWAQYAHSRKVLFWLQEITRISKTSLNMLGLAAGRATTPAEWKSLATLVSYLIDVASIYQRYGHPDVDLDGEIGGLISELNEQLGEAQVSTKREAFKPVAGVFLRLHAALASGKLGKRSGTTFFQIRAAGLDSKLVVHECTRRLQMMSCDDYARRHYPFDGTYQDGKMGPLELDTPVGFCAKPLKMFMKNELVEVLLNHRRLFDMQTTKFPTFGDLPPTPWIGATFQMAGWSKCKRAKRPPMDMSRALQSFAGGVIDEEVAETADPPQQALSQEDYEQLTECPYQRYRPNVAANPLSTKREAQSPAGANSSKKHCHAETVPRSTVSGKPRKVETVTLDDDEEPASRTQTGRLHSDPHPCQGPQGQEVVDSPPPERVQPSTSAIPSTNSITAESVAALAAAVPIPVTTAEPPAAPPAPPVAAEAVLDIAVAAARLDVPDQPTGCLQALNDYDSAAQFSPVVEPQHNAPVDEEDAASLPLPSMSNFWQHNELAPILTTDQEVMDQQEEADDLQVRTPPTPQCHTALGETDEEC